MEEGEHTPTSSSHKVVSSSLDAWLEDESHETPHVPNRLANMLKRRPSREEVVSRGILRPDGEDAPHVPNLLAKKLERRPSIEEVISSGILRTQIKATGKAVTRRRLSADLDCAMRQRPSMDALVAQGIIQSALPEQPVPVDPLDAAEKGRSLAHPYSHWRSAGEYY